jgi:cytochrome P450
MISNSKLTGAPQLSSLVGLLVAVNENEESRSYSDPTEDAHSAESVGGNKAPHSKLSDRAIIDNIKIFLFAGHETAATSISWVLYLLALYPEYETRLLEEINSVMGSMEAFTALSDSDVGDRLKRMQLLNAIMKETLRLFPPAWTINRSPKKDLVIGGYSVPKGTSIMINTLRLHRREDLGWKNPLAFDPDRWIR